MYFFITWESVATLNTLELLDRVADEASIAQLYERVSTRSAKSCNPRTSAANIQVSAGSSCEELLNKSGGTVNPAAPARKASSKETALQRQEPRVKHGVDERRHT